MKYINAVFIIFLLLLFLSFLYFRKAGILIFLLKHNILWLVINVTKIMISFIKIKGDGRTLFRYITQSCTILENVLPLTKIVCYLTLQCCLISRTSRNNLLERQHSITSMFQYLLVCYRRAHRWLWIIPTFNC